MYTFIFVALFFCNLVKSADLNPLLHSEIVEIIHEMPTTQFVYLPPQIKELFINKLSILGCPLEEDVIRWLVERNSNVLPKELAGEIVNTLVDAFPQLIDEDCQFKEYISALENKDAEIYLENELNVTRSSKPKVYCNLLVKHNVQICGDLCVKGTIFGTIEPGVQGPQGPQGEQGPQGPQGVQGPPGPEEYGNVVRVDQVFGNDATGERNGAPFLTINAAIAAALPGDVVWIFPGTYAESFIIPDGVSVVGLSTGSVFVTLDTNVSTDLVTMGENTRLENMALSLTSSSHVQLRGIVFPGTTTSTAKIRTLTLTVDNSTASPLGASNIYGIHANGTGTPGEEISACRASTTVVRSTGGGTKRGLLVDSATRYHVRDSNFFVESFGGAGSYIGAETNHPNAGITMRTSSVTGFTADISQTQGAMTIVTTDLQTENANGLGFDTRIAPANIVWADPGTLPAGISFLRPGSDAASTNEVFVRISQPTIVKSFSVRSRIAPGGVVVDQFIVRKNGIDTLLDVTLTGAQTSNVNDSITVSFATGDSLSVRVNRGAGSAVQDVVVVTNLY